MNRHMVLKCNVLAGLFALTAGIAFGADGGGIDLPEGLKGFKMVSKIEKRELRPGVTYFKTHYAAAGKRDDVSKGLFGKDGPCAIYWLVMEWEKCAGKVSLDIAYNENGQREMPSVWAKQKKAVAWVNGSYHKTTDPSAAIYELKVAGKEVVHNPYDQSLVWNRGGYAHVQRSAELNFGDYEYAISGDGYTAYSEPNFSNTTASAIAARQKGRAPRTFAGSIPEKKITIIGAADGRQPEWSIGLECNEERWLLGKWGVDLNHCVNLDGGGSTMCGIRKGGYSLQSRPSNEKPERRVHHSIQIVDVLPDKGKKSKDKAEAKKKGTK